MDQNNQLTNQQTPWGRVLFWEANSHSASQEIPQLLWNVKVHYHIHNNLSLVPILSQINPVHTLPSYAPKIHPNINLPSTLRSSEWSFPFRFPFKIVYTFLTSPIRATCLAHLIPLDLITLIIFDDMCNLWSSSLCSLLHPPSTSSLLGPNNPLSTPFSYTINLW